METPQDDGSHSARKRSLFFPILGLIFCIILAYIEAPVPLRWLFKKGVIPQGATEIFSIVFYPLETAYFNYPEVQRFYDVQFSKLGI